MTLVRFQDAPGDRQTWVAFKYAPDVVALIKKLPERSFDPATKTWTVPKRLVPALKEAVAELGHEVEGVTPRPKPPPGSTVEFFDEDAAAAEATAKALIASIKPRMQGAVFRAMGKQLYPDLYGRKVNK